MRVGGAVAALVFVVASSAGAHALDFSGDLTLEGRWYPQSPALPGQRSGTAGLVLKPTLYEEVAQSTAVSVSLFTDTTARIRSVPMRVCARPTC